jgi:predicted kinase
MKKKVEFKTPPTLLHKKKKKRKGSSKLIQHHFITKTKKMKGEFKAPC